jgi:hypothetical protein
MPAKMLQKLVTVGLFASAVHVMAGTARATICASPVFQSPVSETVNVPTNTLLWGHGRFGGASPARLIGPGGEVATQERFFTVAIATGTGLTVPVLVPEAELSPNTRYEIEYDYDDADGALTPERVPFTTGSGPLTSTPLAPAVTRRVPAASEGGSTTRAAPGACEWVHAGWRGREQQAPERLEPGGARNRAGRSTMSRAVRARPKVGRRPCSWSHSIARRH